MNIMLTIDLPVSCEYLARVQLRSYSEVSERDKDLNRAIYEVARYLVTCNVVNRASAMEILKYLIDDMETSIEV